MRDEGPLAILESMERVSAAWRRKAAEALKPFGITLAQFELIRHARVFGAMAPSAMADALDWDRPTLTVVARPCLASLWLRKRHSARDRRSFRLELAGPGEELLDRIESARPFAPERIGDPFDVIGADERAQIGRLLDRAARRARDVWARGARA